MNRGDFVKVFKGSRKLFSDRLGSVVTAIPLHELGHTGLDLSVGLETYPSLKFLGIGSG